MGTRNLTIVINKNGEIKVAQYGQYDGHPEGQGVVILKFLLNKNLKEFQNKLDNCYFFKDDDIDKNWTIKEYPQLNRTLGASILNYIYENVKNNKIGLIDKSDFAYDSLFCEWAYVIDFSKNVFEIYKGFQDKILDKNQRFYKNTANEFGYYAVKMIDSYSLNDLPTIEEFCYNFTYIGFTKRQRLKKINRIKEM